MKRRSADVTRPTARTAAVSAATPPFSVFTLLGGWLILSGFVEGIAGAMPSYTPFLGAFLCFGLAGLFLRVAALEEAQALGPREARAATALAGVWAGVTPPAPVWFVPVTWIAMLAAFMLLALVAVWPGVAGISGFRSTEEAMAALFHPLTLFYLFVPVVWVPLHLMRWHGLAWLRRRSLGEHVLVLSGLVLVFLLMALVSLGF